MDSSNYTTGRYSVCTCMCTVPKLPLSTDSRQLRERFESGSERSLGKLFRMGFINILNYFLPYMFVFCHYNLSSVIVCCVLFAGCGTGWPVPWHWTAEQTHYELGIAREKWPSMERDVWVWDQCVWPAADGASLFCHLQCVRQDQEQKRDQSIQSEVSNHQESWESGTCLIFFNFYYSRLLSVCSAFVLHSFPYWLVLRYHYTFRSVAYY